ncbi:unnamed protein product [Brachionus calyciflorus]|uniref:Presenilin n=1 Tax=Brachionus calyciflorus TaxID=104777 RepID=A0A814LSQ6_9BILA|nr:unnamed protein product [Brachionus calyciflorus]
MPDPIEEADFDLKYTPKQALSILKPVTLCMLFTLIIVIITYKARGITDNRENLLTKDGFKATFKTSSKDSTIKSKELIHMALTFLTGLVISTLTILLIVYFNLTKILTFIISFTILVLFIFVNSFFWYTIATYFNLTIDLITSFILVINNAFLSYTSLMWKSPKIMTQFYHIYLSVLLAWYLDTLTPTWLGWMMLIILSIWDLIAVIPQHGPLNMIIKIIDKRGDKLPTALIYSTFFQWKYLGLYKEINKVNKINRNMNNNIDEQRDESQQLKTDKEVNRIIKTYLANDQNENVMNENLDNDDEGPKLGIGDFVFYSLLIAKSASQMNNFTIISCILAILFGLLMTMFLVALLNRPLPALPISIFLAVFIFFVSEFSVGPFCNKSNLEQVFI